MGDQQTGEYIGVKGQGAHQTEFIGVKGQGAHAGRAAQLPMPGMCFYHREIPATYVCSKCGRSICESCDKTYGPLHFCPQCNPFPGGAPPIGPQAQPLPPRGRGLFITGAVGSMFMGVMAIIFGIVPFFALMENESFLDFEDIEVFAGVYIIGAMIFLLGSVLAGVGMAGFYRNYRNASGIVGLVFAVVFSAIFLILAILGFHDLGHWDVHIGIEMWFAHIFAGVMLIIMGPAFLLAGKHTGKRGTGIAAGTLFIVAGSMLIPMLGLIGIAWFVLTAGAFVATYFFASAPAYSKYVPAAQTAPRFEQLSPQPTRAAGMAADPRLEILNRAYSEGKISDEDYMANFEEIQRGGGY